MPYIGNTPALDYISYAVQNFTVTAATTVYTLDYSVSNENDIRLVINNVIQRPGVSYAYSATGTTLTLTSATLATDTMYAVFIGRAVQTVTPPANINIQLADGTAAAPRCFRPPWSCPRFPYASWTLAIANSSLWPTSPLAGCSCLARSWRSS